MIQIIRRKQISFSYLMLLRIASIAAVIVFGFVNTGIAQDVKLNDLKSIRALDPVDAPGAEVDFEATVTHVDGMQEFFFAQDGQEAIFVHRPNFVNIALFQRVRVRGRLAKGDLLPIVSDPMVTVLGAGEQPDAEKVDIIGTEHDCRFLKFEFQILQTSHGATKTMLYAKSESYKDVCIEVLHSDGVALNDVFKMVGNRVQFSGVLGLEIEGGAYADPGYAENSIAGYKIFCESPDALEIVSSENESVDSQPPQVVGLSFLVKDSFPKGRFLTSAQICLIDDSEQPGFVVSDGSTSKRFNLHSTSQLKPGMVVRIGGKKTTKTNGQPEFEVDYLRHLTVAEFPRLELSSIKQAIETFTPDRRIAIEGLSLIHI